MKATSRLHAYLCKLVSEYTYEHQENYKTELLFGTSEENIEQQTNAWRASDALTNIGGLAWNWHDMQIDDTTLMGVIAYEPREDFEAREMSQKGNS